MNPIFVLIRRIVSLSLGFCQRLLGIQPLPLFILCYHGIGTSSFVHDVSAAQFSAQMAILSRTHRFISLDELREYLHGQLVLPGPSVVITFDDGYSSVRQVVTALTQFGIRPALFALATPSHLNRAELANSHPLLTPSELKELSVLGWIIGSHTSTHPDLTRLPPSTLQAEVGGSRTTLSHQVGRSIRYFAYPKGHYDTHAIHSVRRAGYDLAFSLDDTRLTPNSDPYILPRIGINSTHNLSEFSTLYTPWVSKFRQFTKRFVHVG